MKKFKDFIKKSFYDPYVPDEPIHFKMGSDTHSSDDDAYVPDEPIHFKMKSKVSKLKEETDGGHINNWLSHNENSHLGETSKDISHKLIEHQTNHHPMDSSDRFYTNLYSINSSEVNKNLIRGHKKTDPWHEPHRHIKHLDSATNRPIGHHLHLYSGIGFNPARHIKKGGLMHLPAYTSMTHDKDVANSFARKKAKKYDSRHILHVHMNEHDKGIHISHTSSYAGEHETILARNTKLKVHREPTIHHDKEGNKIHIWHAHIVHQD
jgi:hypothetical protein